MIVTLCGSARFEPWFHLWNRALSLAGHAVFGLSSYPSQNEGVKEWYTPEDKVVLDKVHKDKISASDAVLILNPFAYLGESTLSELAWAKDQKKKIYTLESWGEGCGIGHNHNQTVQQAARDFGVWGARSPVDTIQDRGYYLYPFDLFGEAGAHRSRLVALVLAEQEAIKVGT